MQIIGRATTEIRITNERVQITDGEVTINVAASLEISVDETETGEILINIESNR